jgi:hypothetical protein
METLGLDRINRFVLKKQHLSKDAKVDDIVRVTRDIGGLHGAIGTGPYLSLFVRSMNFKKKDLAFELSKTKNLARLRYVRNTIYILPKEFIPVAFAATSRMSAVTAEKYIKYLGISPGYYQRICSKILNVLEGRGLTAKEIRKKLRTSVNITPIVNLMCDTGLLVRGIPKEGWKSTLHTYYLFEDYYPDLDLAVFDEAQAREIVIRKYISSFEPVSERDIAWWTGFPLTQVRRVLEHLADEITPVEVQGLGQGFFMFSTDLDELRALVKKEEPEINILPALDPYLMGYKIRTRYLESSHTNRIFDRSGNATSTILVDGRVVGVWDSDEIRVKIFIFEDVNGDVLREIRLQAAALGAFISELPVQIETCESMAPLTRKTAGAFLSPLKGR